MNLNQKIIKNKVGLLNLAEELGNVSKACKVMGFSRDSFYRYKAAVDEGGLDALIDKSRRKPNHKNRVDPVIEDSVLAIAIDYPAYGQVRAANELRKQGISLSPAGVRGIWMRNNLETMKKRLRRLVSAFKSEPFAILRPDRKYPCIKKSGGTQWILNFGVSIYEVKKKAGFPLRNIVRKTKFLNGNSIQSANWSGLPNQILQKLRSCLTISTKFSSMIFFPYQSAETPPFLTYA